MISTLLLPLLLAGVSPSPAAASQDDPPIRLWINERRFLPGDRAKVQVRTEDDGYLIVLYVNPEGRLRVLFPIDPDKDNFVRGGKKYEVRGRGGREAFEADGKGRGAVYAAVSRDPFRFDGFVLSDHWDYRALAPSRLADDPEPELNELAQRMAQSSFDYDLMTYEVVDRASYASDYYPRSSYYGSVYDDPWCYRFSCGHSYYRSPYSFSIGLFFGRPYRRYYYDPYYYAYDPFYSPFFYDPYYYAPAYYPRYVYPRRHYYGYYDRYHYWDRDRYYSRPYTPYRFRTGEGVDRYRDRRYDLRRSVNTVYRPPISPIREPAAASPARRVIEGPVDELPRGVAPRRAVVQSQPMQRDRIEARRAREPEPTRNLTPGETRGRERAPVEARPARPEADARRHNEAREPRLERRREEPRAVERAPAREPPPRQEAAPPRREVERSAPPPQDRGGSRSEGRRSGGGRSDGGSRPSNGGGRRRS
jgi:hypothetical protein